MTTNNNEPCVATTQMATITKRVQKVYLNNKYIFRYGDTGTKRGDKQYSERNYRYLNEI